MKDWAVIFDMDGTLLDNNRHHLKAWQETCSHYGRELGEEEYNKTLSGKSSADSLKYLFGACLSEPELLEFRRRKEKIYRSLLLPQIAPLPGLIYLLDALKSHRIPMAIASSGTAGNIDFALDNLDIRDYFNAVVNSAMVSNGKPAPDIFLQAAAQLAMPPECCIVFEDSLTGIAAAEAAGMSVIAVSTTHSPETLSHVDRVVPDYRAISYETLESYIG